jgi:hypothetical protein
VEWTNTALNHAGAAMPVAAEETGIGRYRFSIPTADSSRLTIRLHDTAGGRVKTLRWNRGYPAEYRLNGDADASLTAAAPFDPALIREGIQPVRIRSNALPWFGLAAIAFMIAGGVLRRI